MANERTARGGLTPTQYIQEAATGHRGFLALKPPPEGCTGWKSEASPDASPAAASEGARSRGSQMTMQATTLKVETTPTSPFRGGAASMTAITPVSPRSARGDDDDEAIVQAVTNMPRHIAELKDDLAPKHFGPLQGQEHLQAVQTGDMAELQGFDASLQEALAEDAQLLARPRQDIWGRATEEATGAAAFTLYKETLTAFDAAPKVLKQAFRATAADDVETLRTLFGMKVITLEVRNAGGDSLIDVARQRHSRKCLSLLQELEEKGMQPEETPMSASKSPSASRSP
eukprot:TRINITY_DN10559_c0_g1_i1.p1 TRINITY_DN10559_c0_g1~~TRINITY_DN10559_c0_g1_i1.p1  ORF type:complete len:334 (+),score=50.18 TRINITY_DN10559_c0_g1_i1:144-1004(+)